MGYTQPAPLACVFSVLRFIWGVGSLLLTRCIGGGVARAANSFTTTLSWQVVAGHTFPIACIATGKPTEHACDCVILTYYHINGLNAVKWIVLVLCLEIFDVSIVLGGSHYYGLGKWWYDLFLRKRNPWKYICAALDVCTIRWCFKELRLMSLIANLVGLVQVIIIAREAAWVAVWL